MNPPGSFRSPDERPHRNLTTHPQKVTTIKVKVILLARHIPLAVISHSRGRESTICALNDSFISFTCEVRGTHMRRPAQSPHRIVSSKTGRVSGFDPSAHGGDILQLICVVRDWLRANLEPNEKIPGGEHIFERYKLFLRHLREFCEEEHGFCCSTGTRWPFDPNVYRDRSVRLARPQTKHAAR